MKNLKTLLVMMLLIGTSYAQNAVAVAGAYKLDTTAEGKNIWSDWVVADVYMKFDTIKKGESYSEKYLKIYSNIKQTYRIIGKTSNNDDRYYRYYDAINAETDEELEIVFITFPDSSGYGSINHVYVVTDNNVVIYEFDFMR